MEPIVIKIQKYSDFKDQFGNQYTETNSAKKELQEQYRDALFEFHFSNSFFDDKRCQSGYVAIVKKYGIEKFRSIFELDVNDPSIFHDVILLNNVQNNGDRFFGKAKASFIFSYNSGPGKPMMPILDRYAKLIEADFRLHTALILKVSCPSDVESYNYINLIDNCNAHLSKYGREVLQTIIIQFRFDANIYLDEAVRQSYYKFYTAYAETCCLNTTLIFHIENNADYVKFLNKNITTLQDDGSISVSDEVPEDCIFEFVISFKEDHADELLLHNYILLFLRAPKLQLTLKISYCNEETPDKPLEETQKKQLKEKREAEFYRIATYLSGCSNELKRSVSYNGDMHPEQYSPKAYRKILPTIPINRSILLFLRNPLNKDDLEYVLTKFESNSADDKEGCNRGCRQQLLNACRKYLLWYRFDDHESKCYQFVREKAFTSNSFRETVKDMPFLALLLFAQYDYYYRSSIVKEFKTRTIEKLYNQNGKNGAALDGALKIKLNNSDVISDFQQFQDYLRFSVYKEMCQEHMDIKSLLYCPKSKGEHRDERTVNRQSYLNDRLNERKKGNEIKLHEAIVAELFEARTLAEGLLQLIENAVLHANGGLLSARIREYAPKDAGNPAGDTAFLKGKYKAYFDEKAKQKKKGSEAGVDRETDGKNKAVQKKEETKQHSNEEADNEEFVLPEVIGKQFYLEVKLSDIAESNMIEKFFQNAKDRSQKKSEYAKELRDWLNKFQDQLSEEEANSKVFKLFFSPSGAQNELWREYYKISANRVHHFGLQIFDSVLRSRNGGLCVSGHNCDYAPAPFSTPPKEDDPEEPILQASELDTGILGTSYRILLPLNHESIISNNMIVDTSFDRMLSWKEMEGYRSDFGNSIRQIPIDSLSCCPAECTYEESAEGCTFDQKGRCSPAKCTHEKRVEVIADDLQQQIVDLSPSDPDKKSLVVIDYSKLLAGRVPGEANRFSEEELTKSILLVLLRQYKQPGQEPLPTAIIGLKPHNLLEVTRIIALFYDKEGETTEGMAKIQIYLKGQGVGEEILFAGSNINQTADRITRLALTRGSSAEYFSIARQLLIHNSGMTRGDNNEPV